MIVALVSGESRMRQRRGRHGAGIGIINRPGNRTHYCVIPLFARSLILGMARGGGVAATCVTPINLCTYVELT